jgi:hypothetical protein
MRARNSRGRTGTCRRIVTAPRFIQAGLALPKPRKESFSLSLHRREILRLNEPLLRSATKEVLKTAW